MRALFACLLLIASTAHAALQPRDIDADGTLDAYYDTVQGITWLDHSIVDRPAAFGSDALNLFPDLDYFIPWRLPRLLVLDPSSLTCGGTVDAFTCTRAWTPESDEVSIAGFGGGLSQNTIPIVIPGEPDNPYQLSGSLSPTGPLTNFFLSDIGLPTMMWPVADGDWGIAMPVPEPSSSSLLVVGLIALTFRATRAGRSRLGCS